MIDLTIKENAIQLHRDLWNEIADKIWSESYDNGHSGGASEILNYIDEYIEFANFVIQCTKGV